MLLAPRSGGLIHPRKFLGRQNALIVQVLKARRRDTETDMPDAPRPRGYGPDARRFDPITSHAALKQLTLGKAIAQL
jgi:hypothetical protein